MNKNFLIGIACLSTAGCGASLPAPTTDLPAPTTELPAHPGFDTWQYPGDDVMTVWRQTSPYRWVGFYLPSPCHRDDSFSGKRSFLVQSGWGIGVLYVGQQTFDGETPAEVTSTTLCSSALLTPEQGAIDGRDAVRRATDEGFPPGTTIFLDIERMETVRPEMVDYYQAWLRTVLEDGRYGVGTYAHISNAAALYTIAQRVIDQAGTIGDVPFWIAGGSDFSLNRHPESVGYPFAAIWQGVLDAQRTWGGEMLVVDENVAVSGSPSAPPVE